MDGKEGKDRDAPGSDLGQSIAVAALSRLALYVPEVHWEQLLADLQPEPMLLSALAAVLSGREWRPASMQRVLDALPTDLRTHANLVLTIMFEERRALQELGYKIPAALTEAPSTMAMLRVSARLGTAPSTPTTRRPATSTTAANPTPSAATPTDAVADSRPPVATPTLSPAISPGSGPSRSQEQAHVSTPLKHREPQLEVDSKGLDASPDRSQAHGRDIRVVKDSCENSHVTRAAPAASPASAPVSPSSAAKNATTQTSKRIRSTPIRPATQANSVDSTQETRSQAVDTTPPTRPASAAKTAKPTKTLKAAKLAKGPTVQKTTKAPKSALTPQSAASAPPTVPAASTTPTASAASTRNVPQRASAPAAAAAPLTTSPAVVRPEPAAAAVSSSAAQRLEQGGDTHLSSDDTTEVVSAVKRVVKDAAVANGAAKPSPIRQPPQGRATAHKSNLRKVANGDDQSPAVKRAKVGRRVTISEDDETEPPSGYVWLPGPGGTKRRVPRCGPRAASPPVDASPVPVSHDDAATVTKPAPYYIPDDTAALKKLRPPIPYRPSTAVEITNAIAGTALPPPTEQALQGQAAAAWRWLVISCGYRSRIEHADGELLLSVVPKLPEFSKKITRNAVLLDVLAVTSDPERAGAKLFLCRYNDSALCYTRDSQLCRILNGLISAQSELLYRKYCELLEIYANTVPKTGSA